MCIFLEGRFILFFGFPNRLAASPDAPSVRLTAMVKVRPPSRGVGGRHELPLPARLSPLFSASFIFSPRNTGLFSDLPNEVQLLHCPALIAASPLMTPSLSVTPQASACWRRSRGTAYSYLPPAESHGPLRLPSPPMTEL